MDPARPQPPRAGDTRTQGAARYINRELSWLEFNGRVLALACDKTTRVLERIKFLAIVSRNLDEFFQVRVAGLKAQLESGVVQTSPEGRTPREQLAAIRERVLGLVRDQEELFAKELRPLLAHNGIRLVDWESLEATDRSHLERLFQTQIFPVLTPLSVDPAHPFPYISTLSLNLAVVVRESGHTNNRFARLKVPPLLPRFLVLPDGERFVPVEQVIASQLPLLFPGMQVISHSFFRVTLDAELIVEQDEAEDLLSAIRSGLHRRLRMNDAVRLEIESSMAPEIRELLMRELDLEPDDVYAHGGPLDLGGLWALHGLDRPDLRDEPWLPRTQARLARHDDKAKGTNLFAVLREGDVLVHHPYDLFTSSVVAFVEQAASDPRVLAIKHTLYRTSGPGNPIVRALTRAAQSGKEVVALVELQARFDEESNIEWARTLEQAGVHVVYGLVGLKTHAKIVLVVRREPDGIRRYCHVGTGNYNPLTASVYEDVGLLSADPDLCSDLGGLFNYLTGCSQAQGYRKILVAPSELRAALLDQIRKEMDAPDGRIVLKMNGLSDPDMIDALYQASAAGVEIDLIVRGICCLRPGVPGLSEHIRVRSLLGRYLEHSRIFRFGSEARGRRYFIGSADLMQRNLNTRVEVVAPVDDPVLQQRLEEILSASLEDDTLAWELGPEGEWIKVPTRRDIRSQEIFQQRAIERAMTSDEVDHGGHRT